MSSTETHNEAMVRRYTTEVFNERAYDVIEETVAEDFVSHNTSVPEDIIGRDAFLETVRRLHEALPDLEARIQDLVAADEWVATRTTEGGTHKGDLAGLEPTGESFQVEAINLYRIEDGRIAESWIQFDVLGMLVQLGVIEPPE